jgi:hypothetical protein
MATKKAAGETSNDSAIRLEFSADRPAWTDLPGIHHQLRRIGTGVWPIALAGAPAEILRLLKQPQLAPEENEAVLQHFLLPRQKLLHVLADAGRQPLVPGGGAMSTYVASHGYGYPQLFVAEDGVDYSRFDRFHVNVAEDGAGTDEFGQLLAGGPIVIHLRQPDNTVLKLSIRCPSEGQGWLVTYVGDKPHIGSLTQAQPGTKLLVQVIGTPRWSIRYVDEA